MSSASTIPQWQGEVQKHLPSLSLTQARVLGLWSYAMVFTRELWDHADQQLVS